VKNLRSSSGDDNYPPDWIETMTIETPLKRTTAPALLDQIMSLEAEQYYGDCCGDHENSDVSSVIDSDFEEEETALPLRPEPEASPLPKRALDASILDNNPLLSSPSKFSSSEWAKTFEHGIPVKFSPEEWTKTLKDQPFFLPSERPTSPAKSTSGSARRQINVRQAVLRESKKVDEDNEDETMTLRPTKTNNPEPRTISKDLSPLPLSNHHEVTAKPDADRASVDSVSPAMNTEGPPHQSKSRIC
jgi:hypothetical protein